MAVVTISGRPVKETFKARELSNKNGSLPTNPTTGLCVDKVDDERQSPSPTKEEASWFADDILGTCVETCKKSSRGGGRGLDNLWHCLTICCIQSSKAIRRDSRTLAVEFRIFLGGNSQALERSRYRFRNCKNQ